MTPLALLPARPKPLPNELLSSWIIRLAAANGLKLRTFTTWLWPGMALWSRDIDSIAPPAILNTLVARTGTDHSRVIATTLGEYEGRVFAKHNPRGVTTWVLPIGIHPGSKQGTGIQCCTLCLDEALYFRRDWRLAFCTVCVKHRAPLVDQCQRCLSPIRIHRGDMGNRGLFDAGLSTRCNACNSQLQTPAEAETTELRSVATFQESLERAIDGHGTLVGRDMLDPVSLFTGLHAIVHLLASGHNSTAFRLQAARVADVEPLSDDWRAPRRVEHMRVRDRFKLLRLAAELLHNWPERMIAVAKASSVRVSDMLFIEQDLPDWYALGVQSSDTLKQNA